MPSLSGESLGNAVAMPLCLATQSRNIVGSDRCQSLCVYNCDVIIFRRIACNANAQYSCDLIVRRIASTAAIQHSCDAIVVRRIAWQRGCDAIVLRRIPCNAVAMPSLPGESLVDVRQRVGLPSLTQNSSATQLHSRVVMPPSPSDSASP